MSRHRESIRQSSSPNTISVPPRLRATTNWMIAFLWWLQTQKSYRALLSGSSASWRRLSTSSGSNALRLRSHIAAGWTSGFSRGAIRPSPSARPSSSPKSMTGSQNHGTPPTRLAYVLLLLLLSHLLTVLKRKDTSTCLLWMSLWPEISARPRLSDGRWGQAIRPSRAEPHLHSLDTPTQRLDKQLRHYTLWLCSRSSRPRCSPVRKPVWRQLHSGTWGAW